MSDRFAPVVYTLGALALAAGAAILARPARAETVDGASIVIVDGDTVAVGAERVRLLDIDAPETWHPRCERELVIGLEAKQRLRALLAGPVEIERHGRDRYGRTLARLRTPGGDAGAALLADGLAVRWQPGRDALGDAEQIILDARPAPDRRSLDLFAAAHVRGSTDRR